MESNIDTTLLSWVFVVMKHEKCYSRGITEIVIAHGRYNLTLSSFVFFKWYWYLIFPSLISPFYITNYSSWGRVWWWYFHTLTYLHTYILQAGKVKQYLEQVSVPVRTNCCPLHYAVVQLICRQVIIWSFQSMVSDRGLSLGLHCWKSEQCHPDPTWWEVFLCYWTHT